MKAKKAEMKRFLALYKEHETHILAWYALMLITNIRYVAEGTPYAACAWPALVLQCAGAALYAWAPRPAWDAWVRAGALAVGGGGGALCATLSLLHARHLLACTGAGFNAWVLALVGAEVWMEQSRDPILPSSSFDSSSGTAAL